MRIIINKTDLLEDLREINILFGRDADYIENLLVSLSEEKDVAHVNREVRKEHSFSDECHHFFHSDGIVNFFFRTPNNKDKQFFLHVENLDVIKAFLKDERFKNHVAFYRIG